jgi:hypothetical protein
MNTMTRRLARVTALAIGVAAGVLCAAGTAAAADYLKARPDTGDGGAVSIGGDAYGYNDDNDSETWVHPSKHGISAVNSAGDGTADQRVDQTRSDSSRYIHHEDHTRTDSHDNLNSHNSGRYEDSHDDIRVRRDY